MKRRLSLWQMVVLSYLLLLSGCAGVESFSHTQENTSQTKSSMPEVEDTDWMAVSTDAAAFDLNGGLDNPNFEYVLDHTDTVPLDQLIAFTLVADGLSEGACDELRSRFLEAPNTVLTYLMLMGDQQVGFWDNPPAAEVICRFIASADAAWYGGSEEFARTMETCRESYPSGPIAELLDVMETEHEASMERNQ